MKTICNQYDRFPTCPYKEPIVKGVAQLRAFYCTAHICQFATETQLVKIEQLLIELLKGFR
jgi:hypothetical protein